MINTRGRARDLVGKSSMPFASFHRPSFSTDESNLRLILLRWRPRRGCYIWWTHENQFLHILTYHDGTMVPNLLLLLGTPIYDRF